ncbi:ClpXP protease specificity-enhancing factor [Methylotenera versatilis]|uniref:ClpXP protease specificity-enhancing factor n=1 Tax=Methylotenera versatilis TaxID=1055487 RepID=UPI00064670F7|nr:ClpXP protease specificity-enhancing factor [Methylotenera versatilis]
MSDLISTKPYMIRAIHEWCVDNNLTPHLLVAVNTQTRVPIAFVKDGEIVLNLNYSATKDLHMDNEAIVFSARFGGVSQNLYVPMNAVKGIFARENGQGMFFEIDTKMNAENVSGNVDSDVASKSTTATEKKKPTLTIVK